MLGLAISMALPIACFESISATGDVNLHKPLARQIAYSTSAFVGLVVLRAMNHHLKFAPAAAAVGARAPVRRAPRPDRLGTRRSPHRASG
jgi:hypothetical protein